MSGIFDFSTFPELTTDRLHLRQLTTNDADAIMALFSDPRMLQFLNMDPVDTREKALDLINWFKGNYDRGEAVQWAVTLRDSGVMIGSSGTYDWHKSDQHVDIGYHILPGYWGQGYASESTRAILRWCFTALQVHRVQADCTDGNIASERVLLKCDFSVEGLWRESCWEHGRFVSIKQFGLLRHEFEAHQA